MKVTKQLEAFLEDTSKGKFANLQCEDLSDANLCGANLSDADLRGTDFSGARLSSADLRNAYLRDAKLSSAYLRNANLQGANLQNANLRFADLKGANLQNANLQGANLSGADLRNADLTDALLSPYMICPSHGDFIAYKKVVDLKCLYRRYVIKIQVLGERTSSLVGRKCRTDKAIVIDRGTAPADAILVSMHDHQFEYPLGIVLFEPKYDADPKVECTSGIHFFVTSEEAEDYC